MDGCMGARNRGACMGVCVYVCLGVGVSVYVYMRAWVYVYGCMCTCIHGCMGVRTALEAPDVKSILLSTTVVFGIFPVSLMHRSCPGCFGSIAACYIHPNTSYTFAHT